MKTIQAYKKESLEKLKQWITEMNEKGHEQYYEIFVDATKVVPKTNDTELFDGYLIWLDTETQAIKVLTYNTKNSHRSKPFEFRTNKFIEEVNYKEQAEGLEKKNEELIKRLSDAETYIQNLEEDLEKKEKEKSDFDLQSILSGLGAVTSQYPDLANSLGGLGGILKTSVKPEEKKEEFYEASFKKKESNPEPIKNETPFKVDLSANNKQEEKVTIRFTTESQLKDEAASKLYKLMEFFCEKPEYIDVVYELVIKEEGKKAA